MEFLQTHTYYLVQSHVVWSSNHLVCNAMLSQFCTHHCASNVASKITRCGIKGCQLCLDIKLEHS